MRGFITEEDAEKALHYISDNAEIAARAKARLGYLGVFTKSLIAMIMSEHLGLPVNAQEREALRDPRVLKHLEVLEVAEFEYERHKFMMKASEITMDAWRTQKADERAMQL